MCATRSSGGLSSLCKSYTNDRLYHPCRQILQVSPKIFKLSRLKNESLEKYLENNISVYTYAVKSIFTSTLIQVWIKSDAFRYLHWTMRQLDPHVLFGVVFNTFE